MAIIQAENPDIRRELEKLEDLVSEGGGGVHSELVIRESGGGLSIETSEPMAPDREIIRLSREIVLPTDKCDIVIKNGQFDVTYPKNSNMTTLQRKLMESMLSLYNLTNKVALHEEYSFLLSLKNSPALLERLAQGRPFGSELAKWQESVVKAMPEEKYNEFLKDTYLKTRHLGYNDYVRANAVRILMPIVDFLNHHWHGSTFIMGKGARVGDLSVGCRQLIEGSLECFAFYNVMDSHDALYRYDFVDAFAPVVRSVPLELTVPGEGTIRINSNAGAVDPKKLTKEISDLFRFIPYMAREKDKNLLTASHLMIPGKDSPRALRRILYLLLINLTGRQIDKEEALRWIEEVEEQILVKNLEYYNGLLDMIAGLPAEETASFGVQRIRELALLQKSKIEAYRSFQKTFIPPDAAQAQSA
jgi:hypothetical protein